MQKAELVSKVREMTGLKANDVKDVLDAAFATINGAVLGGDPVRIQGFGTFKEKVRAAHAGRNPSNGQTIQVPEKRTIGFTAAKVASV